MLRAARRHAEKASGSLELLKAIADEQYRAGDVPGGNDTARAVEEALKDKPCALAKALATLAEARWGAGLRAQAEATIKEALEAGRKTARDERARCLEPLALAQGRLGDFEGALATVAEMPGARDGDLFPYLSKMMAEHGRYDEAVALSDKANALYGDWGIQQALALQAAYGDWRTAAAEERRIFGPRESHLLADAAVAAAEAGDFERAEAIAASTGPSVRAGFAVALAHHGRIADAVRLATSNLAGNHGATAMQLIRIADIAESSGDRKEAARILDLAMAESAKAPERGGHANRRLLILVRQGKMDEALHEVKTSGSAGWLTEDLARAGLISEALQAAELIDLGSLDRDGGGRGLDALAEAQLLTEDIDGARATLKKHRYSVYGPMQRRMAAALARRGRPLEALAFIAEQPLFRERDAALVELIAQEEARSADWMWQPLWFGRLTTPDEKARAWLGAARGIRLRRVD